MTSPTLTRTLPREPSSTPPLALMSTMEFPRTTLVLMSPPPTFLLSSRATRPPSTARRSSPPAPTMRSSFTSLTTVVPVSSVCPRVNPSSTPRMSSRPSRRRPPTTASSSSSSTSRLASLAPSSRTLSPTTSRSTPPLPPTRRSLPGAATAPAWPLLLLPDTTPALVIFTLSHGWRTPTRLAAWNPLRSNTSSSRTVSPRTAPSPRALTSCSTVNSTSITRTSTSSWATPPLRTSSPPATSVVSTTVTPTSSTSVSRTPLSSHLRSLAVRRWTLAWSASLPFLLARRTLTPSPPRSAPPSLRTGTATRVTSRPTSPLAARSATTA
mmetsp:Transcript_126952/g.179113  ORF Transcript_126952/g.179113 Transcript_126952/m.179113 type:complete len:325 (+) Transcript_126952:235-1209(+)